MATAVANVVGTEASIPLGKAYNAGMMGEIPHKVSHGIVGCVTGAIANFATDSAETSCISGAAGQVAGEMAGQAYLKAQFPIVNEDRQLCTQWFYFFVPERPVSFPWRPLFFGPCSVAGAYNPLRGDGVISSYPIPVSNTFRRV